METKPRCATCRRFCEKNSRCYLLPSRQTKPDWVYGQWKQKEKKDVNRTDSE